jgi:succinate-semialdehyde dehydrogenase / glutarate-semialdehyde dehydrogenase
VRDTMTDVSSGFGYRSINPATGELVRSFDTATNEDVAAALSSAHQAYEMWRTTSVAERAAIVQRVGDLFLERADELAVLVTTEVGKPLAEARDEAAFCRKIFGYYASEGPRLLADQPIRTMSGGSAVMQKLPIGPVLGIMPWNYPYYQVARFAAPNLVLGNVVIIKHAESVPQSALAIAEIMADAGLSPGTYANLFVSHAQVEEIIADPRVAGVSLTGSERAGAAVAASAGRHLKKCVLELGGSDPYIVLDTDDVVEAADLAWDTRMSNSGQACTSNKRMIVMDAIFDDFVARLIERAARLTAGDPAEASDETFAPLSSRAAAERLHEQVQDAVLKGATLHAGGELMPDPAAYYSPAVLTGVTSSMRAYHEELFGPVAVVYPVSSDEEAIELANDTPYGLGGAVFSTDRDRAKRVAARLDVGMSNVCTPARGGAEIPFGGVKRSGFGRELGPLGMDEFVNKRIFYTAD